MTDAYARYETNREACVVLTTCPDEAAAARLARALVECRLAACVTRVPGATSVYRWRGEIEEDAEVQLIIKTRRAQLEAVGEAIEALHPDDQPELIVLDVRGGAPGYLHWIEEETSEVTA